MVRADGERGDQLGTLSLSPFASLRLSEVRDSLAKGLPGPTPFAAGSPGARGSRTLLTPPRHSSR